jgi:hypothetical protein
MQRPTANNISILPILILVQFYLSTDELEVCSIVNLDKIIRAAALYNVALLKNIILSAQRQTDGEQRQSQSWPSSCYLSSLEHTINGLLSGSFAFGIEGRTVGLRTKALAMHCLDIKQKRPSSLLT